MKRNIMDIHSEQQVIDRILKLSSASKRMWGNMTINEMLFHCRKVNSEILQADKYNKSPTVKQRIMKTIGLYLMKNFPKGIKTSPKYLPDLVDNIDFQKMQKELIDNIKEVCNYNNPIYGEHPFFGPLSTKEWRHFMWKHVDHHLRQFNV